MHRLICTFVVRTWHKQGFSWPILNKSIVRDYFRIIPIIIGTKHDFLCNNICWAPRKVLKPEPKGPGADLNGSENRIWSLLLHKQFCYSKLWRKCFEKFFFSSSYNECFENSTSRANDVTKLCLIMCVLLMMPSDSVTVTECSYVKLQSRVLAAFYAIILS